MLIKKRAWKGTFFGEEEVENNCSMINRCLFCIIFHHRGIIFGLKLKCLDSSKLKTCEKCLMKNRPTYLKMKINKISNEKNMATLSIVRSMTNNCRLKFGMNRTNFNIRSNRNVLKTDKPEFVAAPSRMNAWHSSTALLHKSAHIGGLHKK